MDVFGVRDQLVGDYREFTGSFVDIHDAAIREHVGERMAKGYQWPDPWLSLNPSFAPGGTASGWSHLLRASGRYPLTGRGDVNTYAVFAETARTVIGPRGRLGTIVPTGIATDAITAPFFRDIIRQKRLDSFLGFVTNSQLWTDVGNRRYRFSILIVTGSRATAEQTEFATLTKHPPELPPRGHRINVPTHNLLIVNPNSGTCPMFQTQRDADIALGISNRVPALWREHPKENSWGLSFMAMLHMANDSGLFHATDKGDVLPLYEAKTVHHFDHRLSSYDKRPEGSLDTELPRLDLDEKNDPYRSAIPRYWVDRKEINDHLARRKWNQKWLLSWRDITNATNERTIVATLISKTTVGHTFSLMFTLSPRISYLYANLNSFALDYVARQKISGVHLTFGFVMQLPVLQPNAYYDDKLRRFIESRILELTYTAWNMEPFARDLGDDGPPFHWDEDHRFQMRAELDAAFFHLYLYGIPRDDVEYIMETFPIVKRKDIAAHGTYRTKEAILKAYDEMAAAKQSSKDYQTP